MIRSSKISLTLMFILVLFISLIPVFHIGISLNKVWKGVVPEYIEDSSYYYARINDVVRGHPLIGNPYFIEHKDALPPAFFLSDWLASLTFFTSLPFSTSAALNIILWSEISVLILYIIFYSLGATPIVSATFSVLTYLQVFWLFVRPVSLQVIFPAYLLFLLAFWFWCEDQESKRNKWLLLLSSIYAVYVYTYLMQIVFVTFGVFIIYLLVTRQFSKFKDLSKLLGLLFTTCIPFIIITAYQISDPFYFETIKRIGLLNTHIPRMEFVYYGRWVVLALILWFSSVRWIPDFKIKKNEQIFTFLLISGLSLVIVSGSNIITGKELELANHIGRFILVWFPIAFFMYALALYRSIKINPKSLTLFKEIFIGVLILFGVVVMVRNIPRAFPFFRNSTSFMASVQDYAGPLNWLQSNEPNQFVTLTSDSLSAYVPIMTRHYVLFNQSGALQLLSDKELEDRYLVSRFLFGGATRQNIEKDIGLYGGAGKALLASSSQKHFDYLYNRYKNDIEPDISLWLRNFIVRYVIVDILEPVEIRQAAKLSSKEIYRDRRFVIYRLLP